MSHEIINTQSARTLSTSPGSLPYSQAVRAAGLVFVSGQMPFDPETGDVVGSTIQQQTRQTLTNVEAILAAAGASMADIVSATFFLLRPEDFPGMNEEWVRWFPTDPPARQGARLWSNREDVLIGVAVIAAA
jgi:2-iminobutanoate/2-iminopropanoate deaminase